MTADSSDSTPARNAIVNALGRTALTAVQLMSGRCGIGSVRGSSPNRLPIVGTSKVKSHTTTELAITAIKKPGCFGAYFRNSTMMASAPSATNTEAKLVDGSALAYAIHFSMKSAGTSVIVKPKRSLI